MEDRLYDMESMWRFAGVSLDDIPDETTIYKSRLRPRIGIAPGIRRWDLRRRGRRGTLASKHILAVIRMDGCIAW